jgi:hypothetical protein
VLCVSVGYGVGVPKNQPTTHHSTTQAARLAAAVLFAPLADRLIDAVRTSLRLRSKKAAFAVCVLTLCALASGVLVGKTLTWV